MPSSNGNSLSIQSKSDDNINDNNDTISCDKCKQQILCNEYEAHILMHSLLNQLTSNNSNNSNNNNNNNSSQKQKVINPIWINDDDDDKDINIKFVEIESMKESESDIDGDINLNNNMLRISSTKRKRNVIGFTD